MLHAFSLNDADEIEVFRSWNMVLNKETLFNTGEYRCNLVSAIKSTEIQYPALQPEVLYN